MKDTMSLDELRSILINVDNQELTVRELKNILADQIDSALQFDRDELAFAIDAITQGTDNEKV